MTSELDTRGFKVARPDISKHAGRRIDLDGVLSAVLGTSESTRVGRFVIEAKIGEGGMGVVYRAHDPVLDRNVAIKVLKGGGDGIATDGALREARALARVSHPAVVAVHDIGTADGDSYIAMEYVAGSTLREWLDTHEDASWQAVVGLFRQAAQGVAAAHRCGVVHRDFKPDNVLVDAEQRVRVADFGVALLDDTDGDGSGRPPGSSIVGTPRFMAPEQRRGERVDARSDQYAFCFSLLRALDRKSGSSTPQRELPPRLRAVLDRGLSDDPDLRWPSMDDLVTALDQVLHQPLDPRLDTAA